MNKKYTKVDFKNAKNPSSDFDLVSLRQLLKDDYSSHSPFVFHQLRFFSIVFIQSGTGKHTIDFTDYDCKKGTLLIIRKDQIHKFSESNLEGVILVFTLEFLGSFYAKTEAQKSLLLFNEFLNSPKLQLTESQFLLVSQLIERLKEEYFYIFDKHSPGIIRSELQILISKLYRLKTRKHEVTNSKKYISEFIRFHNFIEERFPQSLKVKDYAKWMNLSTKTLNIITRRIVQKPAKEFIDEICLNHIKRQLINSEKTVKEISYESGFEETSNFYNYFKKRVGKTPEKYRKANR